MQKFALPTVLMIACGTAGPTGPAGPKGDTGDKGSAGTSAQIYEYCVHTNPSLILNFYYENVTYSDASVFVSCSIAGPSTESSHAVFHASNTNGAIDGGCIVTYDLDTPTFGSWYFSQVGATYDDDGSPYDGLSVMFGPGECVNP